MPDHAAAPAEPSDAPPRPVPAQASALDRPVPPRRPRRARLAVMALAVGYALAAAGLVLAWAVAGDPWWLQPWNMTTFWWSLPAVGLVVVAVLSRRWRVAAALAVPALVWLWSYGTLFLPELSSPPEPDLTVVNFNTFVATPDISHVLDLVDRVDPDVLLLQEVFPSRQLELEEALADRLPHMTAVQSEGVGGVMVASRFPIVDQLPVAVPEGPARDTLVAVLDVGGTHVQVVPVHLRSPCPTCGDSMIDRLRTEGHSRVVEIAAVLAALEPDVPAIIGGDFNSTERSMPYRILAGADFRDAQRERGSGPGFTWPADDTLPWPVFRIDWQLARGLTPVTAWVDRAGPSDHRPVVATWSFQALSQESS